MKGSTLSSRLQPPVRRSASISIAHIARPAMMTFRGAPSDSQPYCAALRTFSISQIEAAKVAAARARSYQGMRFSEARSVPGKIRNVNGSISAIRR